MFLSRLFFYHGMVIHNCLSSDIGTFTKHFQQLFFGTLDRGPEPKHKTEPIFHGPFEQNQPVLSFSMDLEAFAMSQSHN